MTDREILDQILYLIKEYDEELSLAYQCLSNNMTRLLAIDAIDIFSEKWKKIFKTLNKSN